MILYKPNTIVPYTLARTRDTKEPVIFHIRYLPHGEYHKYSLLYADAIAKGQDDKEAGTKMYNAACRKQFLENVESVEGIVDMNGSPITDPRDMIDLLPFSIIEEVTTAMRDAITLSEAQVKNSERGFVMPSKKEVKTVSPSNAKLAATTSSPDGTVKIEKD